MLQTIQLPISLAARAAVPPPAESVWPQLLDGWLLVNLGVTLLFGALLVAVVRRGAQARQAPGARPRSRRRSGTSIRHLEDKCALSPRRRFATLCGRIEAERPASSPLTGEPCTYSHVKLFDPQARERDMEDISRWRDCRDGALGWCMGTRRRGFWDVGVELEVQEAGVRKFVPDWACGAHLRDETGTIPLDFGDAHVSLARERTTTEDVAIKAALQALTGESASEYMLRENKLSEEYLPLDTEVVLTGDCVANPNPMAAEPFVFRVSDIKPADASAQMLHLRELTIALAVLTLLSASMVATRAFEISNSLGESSAPAGALPEPEPLIRR